MRMSRSPGVGNKTQVVVLTADADFEQLVRSTFNASAQIELRVVTGTLAEYADGLDFTGATVVVVDLEGNRDEDMLALQRLTARTNLWPPVVAILPAFDANSFTEAFKVPGFDATALLDIQRRNVEALIAANQTLAQGLQTVAQRQSEIARQTVAQFQDLLSFHPSSTSVEATLVRPTVVPFASRSPAVPSACCTTL